MRPAPALARPCVHAFAHPSRCRALLLSLWLACSLSGCFLVGYDGLSDAGPGGPGKPMDAASDSAASPHDAASVADSTIEVPDTGAPDGGWLIKDDGGEFSDADAGGQPDAGTPPDDAGTLSDASLPDAGPEEDAGYAPDAGRDAGGTGGSDAGEWWEDATPIKACTNPFACQQQCGAADAPCLFECSSASCVSSCQTGTTCRNECKSPTSCVNTCAAGATCSNDCTSLQCSTSCGAGSTCSLECHGSTSCTVSCTSGAHCLAVCTTGVCDMRCSGAKMSCPGGVITCDRPCP
jgi:hypothetical protein